MDKIQVNIILEILGRPVENVQLGLSALIDKLGKEKGIKILEQTSHAPVPVKESKDLFTSFAELMLELDSLDNYFGLMFSYMPSNIELIHPEKISLRNDDLNSLGNRLLLRLHDYDSIAKKMIFERDIAIGKLKEHAPHLFQKQQTQSQQSPLPAAKKAKSSKLRKKSKKK